MHQTEFIDLKLRIIHFTKAHKIDFQNENLHQKCVVDCQKKFMVCWTIDTRCNSSAQLCMNWVCKRWIFSHQHSVLNISLYMK